MAHSPKGIALMTTKRTSKKTKRRWAIRHRTMGILDYTIASTKRGAIEAITGWRGMSFVPGEFKAVRTARRIP
jgi:hypothetical protein